MDALIQLSRWIIPRRYNPGPMRVRNHSSVETKQFDNGEDGCGTPAENSPNYLNYGNGTEHSLSSR